MQAYTQFASRMDDGEQPERLVLVNDVSGSMKDSDWPPTRLAGAVEAGCALIRIKAQQSADDEVGVVAFSFSGWVMHGAAAAGRNATALTRAMQALRVGGGTNMSAGLETAGTLLDGRPAGRRLVERVSRWVFGQGDGPQRPQFRRRVILLTDGCHNEGPSPRKVARALKDAGTVIDCIGIGGGPAEVDEKLLKDLASQDPDGKPRYRFIGDKSKLISTYKKLANRIRLA